ncbi:MAG: polyribonucleotide nucleotidyltransferase [Parcubacteria group bacterium]|jgi:polyribonucleotide nucleotidyltransferase|nr:polyribonucleotide nucleotidyltransferase [Parcubacteria group bacterium]|tara:strand:- start:17157 stop:19280 length:2124 start_codon:yes stop_codon:yes gene_type:complete
MSSKQFKTDWAGRELKVEVGQLAQQANGSVLLTYGQTVVLATCVMSQEARDLNYLPLSVEYEEKLYAAGKIKGSRFIKREGRPTDEAVLTGRMIDRIIRPRFNQKIRNSIQVILTVLSFDKENDPDIPALIAASLALGISDIPWQGPIAGLRIGRALVKDSSTDQEWILNPTLETRQESDLDLVVAGRQDKINMLEGGAKQVSEESFLSAIGFAQSHLKKIVEFQDDIIKEIGQDKAKLEIQEPAVDLVKQIQDQLADKLEKVIYQLDKKELYQGLELLEKELINKLVDDSDEQAQEKTNQVKEILDQEIGQVIHKNILAGKEKRTDGRKLDQVRPLKCQVSFLPRTHGSGLFQRGETQALSSVTLGGPNESQIIDGLKEEYKKSFIHHYNFPPYCVGETGRMFGPGRREIGHGALAEKALVPLLPDKEKFPYTVRLVSEILSSNGSSSMASACGSSLALMDAGVPMKKHVAGIAMGVIMGSDGDYRVLTDIAGLEDHHGGMDCKIAGTDKGVTACQMDVKIEGATLEMLKKVFEQARTARLTILKEMAGAIKEPRAKLSPLAPRIITLRIAQDKIRDVIGPGGKVINEIIDQTGVKIDIEDDGLVNITSTDEQAGQKALEWVKNLTREVKAGEVFQGKVTKIIDFGAFVEILPGQEGLVHISELAPYRVEKVEDVVKLGQTILVKVKEIDHLGRINLSLKEANPKA